MQNRWILPKVKYFLSVEAIFCQFPNLWFLQLTPRSDLALTARDPPTNKTDLERVLSAVGDQTRATDSTSVVSASLGLYTGSQGWGGMQGTHLGLRVQGRVVCWKPCLEWISEDEQEWAHGKGEKPCFGQKRDIVQKGAWHTSGAAPCHTRVESRIAKELKR